MLDIGVRLIKAFEGFRRRAYKDPVGIWTVGYGFTRYPTHGFHSVKVSAGDLMDEAHASNLLLTLCEEIEGDLLKDDDLPALSANQLSALVSFIYNVGYKNFRRSTMYKRLKASNFISAANEFERWNKAGGKVLKGLTDRREAERLLFVGDLEAVEKIIRKRS